MEIAQNILLQFPPDWMMRNIFNYVIIKRCREHLFHVGEAYSGCKQPAASCYEKIIDTVYGLQETGPTALGPAIACAIGIASKAPGSKVFFLSAIYYL